jgi:hypothetical protein
MKINLIESETPSKVTFMGNKLSFYENGVYHKTKISNPQHIIIVDEYGKTISSSSEELTPGFVISDNDIESIVEFYNRSGNLPDFYLFDKDV